MKHQLAQIALLVRDYDEAIQYYRDTLHFELVEDTILSPEKRWVVMSPSGGGCCLLLAKASNERQQQAIGNQSGGRVFLFLFTDDILRDIQHLQNRGLQFIRPLTQEEFGQVAVFEDLYGNAWDLIQPNEKNQLARRNQFNY